MQLPILSVALCCIFSTAVLADPHALFAETLFFYYAYKIQWYSGLPKTMGGDCARAWGDEACDFAEFVRQLMPDEFTRDDGLQDLQEAGNPHFPLDTLFELFNNAREEAYETEGRPVLWRYSTVDSRFDEEVRHEHSNLIRRAKQNIMRAIRHGRRAITLEDLRGARRNAAKAYAILTAIKSYKEVEDHMFLEVHPQFSGLVVRQSWGIRAIDWDLTRERVNRHADSWSDRLRRSLLRIIDEFPRRLGDYLPDTDEWRQIRSIYAITRQYADVDAKLTREIERRQEGEYPEDDTPHSESSDLDSFSSDGTDMSVQDSSSDSSDSSSDDVLLDIEVAPPPDSPAHSSDSSSDLSLLSSHSSDGEEMEY